SKTSSAQDRWDFTIAVPFQTIHTLCGFAHVHRLKRVNGGVFFGKDMAVFVPTTIAIHGHFLYYYDAEGKEPHPDDKAKGGCYLLGATIVGISKSVLEERRELANDSVYTGSVAEKSNKALLDAKRSSTGSHVGTNELLIAAEAVGKQNSHGILGKFMTNMRAAIGKININTKAVTGEGVQGKARNFFSLPVGREPRMPPIIIIIIISPLVTVMMMMMTQAGVVSFCILSRSSLLCSEVLRRIISLTRVKITYYLDLIRKGYGSDGRRGLTLRPCLFFPLV
ncbi:hypothetical protein TcCL_ESM04134, partial [Trypanosoma cruzi]